MASYAILSITELLDSFTPILGQSSQESYN